MKFNVNDYVRVKLTPTGKEILRKQFEERHERMPQVFKELSLPEEDENGFSQWQMWRLFETFGEHIFLGCEPPFETEIEIVGKAFQQSVQRTGGESGQQNLFSAGEVLPAKVTAKSPRRWLRKPLDPRAK